MAKDVMVNLDDSEFRQAAIDPTRSFIVTAPAGSGKTGLITQRYLALLANVENPEEILCITFTRKAASEMLGRVLTALEYADTNPCPTNPNDAKTWSLARGAIARSNELQWNLLDLPWRLRIQTIDGFARHVSNHYALESSLGYRPNPCNQPLIHYKTAARTLLSRIEEENLIGKYLGTLLGHLGNDFGLCEHLLCDLLERREQWLPLIYNIETNPDYFHSVIERITCEHLENLTNLFESISDEFLFLTRQAASRVSREINPELERLRDIKCLPHCCAANLTTWKSIICQFVSKTHSWRRRLTKNEGYPPSAKQEKKHALDLIKRCEEIPGLLQAMISVLRLPENHKDSSQHQILVALGYLLPYLVAELNVIFEKDNECDFSAITLLALDALKSNDPSNVVSHAALQLDYRLKHILIDEFQDTSAIQIKLIELLLEGWEPDDGRSIFLVGDAMQSMYSFRNANVGLFLRAQQNSIAQMPIESLTLTTNFRSQELVIDWINEYFSSAFPSQEDPSLGAVTYTKSVSVKRSTQKAAVNFFGYSGDDYGSFEARRICEICKQVKSNHPNDSIAILARNRGHLKAITPALGQNNIDWQGIDLEPLSKRMHVVDMLSLARALMSPSDRIAWLSVLHAPFCGLGLEDLLVIVNSTRLGSDEKPLIIDQLMDHFGTHENRKKYPLSDYGLKALARIVPVLKNFWLNRRRQNLRESLEECWTKLGGMDTLQSEKDYEDLTIFLDLISQTEVGGIIQNWESFQLAVESLSSRPTFSELANKDQNPVKIMTMHKAKGLEFDHVILPGLSHSVSERGKPLLLWNEYINKEGRNDFIIATRGSVNQADDELYSYLRHERTIQSRLENTRVLYTAATRAVHSLHLFGELKTNGSGWRAPSPNSLLTSIWPRLSRDIENERYAVHISENKEKYKFQKDSPNCESMRRLVKGYKPKGDIKKGINNYSKQTSTASDPASQTQKTPHESSFRSMQLGKCLHRTLKQIVRSGLEKHDVTGLEHFRIGWHSQLKENGILSSPDELDELQRSLKNMLADPFGKWLLQTDKKSSSEVMFDYRADDGSQIKRSTIDLTFLFENTRWIIDYKYAHPSNGQNMKKFVDNMKDQYRGQLHHYASLLRGIEDNPIRCGLYLPRLPLFIEIPY